MATLGERMAKTMPDKPKNVEKDQCSLVRIHSGKPGVPLAGHRAIACTMFEAR